MNQQIIDVIRQDILRCRDHPQKEGSQRLYGELVAKYSAMIPDFEKNLSVIGKAALVGEKFDYRDELNAIAAKLEFFLLSNTEIATPPRFYALVDQIPEIEKAFYDSGGVMVIYNTKPFMEWKENIKYELRKLKQDDTITETLRDLDRFQGWTDRKLFGEVTSRCKLIRDNYNSYIENVAQEDTVSVDRKKVFIVHGRDTATRDNVELFLRRIGLEPVILANEANEGLTVIEKFEKHSEVSFAIVLYTACDEGRLKGTADLKDRARQNVIFEHGYFCAKLGRGNVVALHEADVEVPSDLSGILYISLDGDWKAEIKKELHAAGIEANWTIT